MVRTLYSALFAILLPLILLRIWIRSFKAPAYRERLAERFGFAKPIPAQPIWIHAVSVGEVMAIAPVVERLIEQYPSESFLITTTTPTGAAQVQRIFGDRVAHRYLPWDLPSFVARFLKRTQPKLGIIVETELWPNLLAGCQRHQIPVLLANARLSERSARGYARFARLTREALRALTTLCVQNSEDAQRFLALGADPDSVLVTGSIKFDAQIDPQLIERGLGWREVAGVGRPIWIAASTHEGEDRVALNAWSAMQRQGLETLLILVPRHPERFQAVYEQALRTGAQVGRRSEDDLSEQIEIWVGDSLGELPAYYAMADLAFVGGSFSGTGGHNPLEPALLKKPILMGPSRYNFQQITDRLIAAGALRIAEDESALYAALQSLLSDAEQRQSMGQAGYEYAVANRGATERLLAQISALIDLSVRSR